MQLIRIALITVLICWLQGCMDAAVTGVQVAYNHDHIQKTFNDQYITTQAYRKIYRDTDRFDDTNISIATFHREVLLTGQARSTKERREIQTLVEQIPDVKRTYNLIVLTTPSSALVRLSDAWITTKIKSKLIAMNDIDPNQVKVVTENGTVFLMGMVLPEQADIAIDVARNTDGVQHVINILSYLRISKT
jgi:osmotically-inducible protein OsmY